MDSIEGTRNLMELQEQYNAIIADNVEIQKELVEISTKTKLLEVVALPLQVVSFACQGEPSVKKIIWSAVETSPTQHFENMELTKQLFMDFDFIGLLTSLQTA